MRERWRRDWLGRVVACVESSEEASGGMSWGVSGFVAVASFRFRRRCGSVVSFVSGYGPFSIAAAS